MLIELLRQPNRSGVTAQWAESYPAGMKDLALPLYSKKLIENAGKILRRSDLQPRVFDDHYKMSTEDAFRIAHNWRSAHMLPLLRVRQELSAKCRQFVGSKPLTAARLKRMQAIRRKLRRPFTLYQIQDIAGCRAILGSMAEVERMIEIYRNGESRYSINAEDDYISSPKVDGYRSHHVIVNFVGEGDLAVYNRQTVEVQLRTRLQHVWATAVEAVGLMRHENLKGGKGSAEWLRFFALMSGEFADIEHGGPVPGIPQGRAERRKEIRELAKALDAETKLESYRVGIDLTDDLHISVGLDRYFLLQFDYETREVSVMPFEEYAVGSDRYIEEETNNQKRNTVLVEVDAVSDLKSAFPNYFLDVTIFTDRLLDVMYNREPQLELELEPEAPPSTKLAPQDWQVLKNWQFWRDKAKNRPRWEEEGKKWEEEQENARLDAEYGPIEADDGDDPKSA